LKELDELDREFLESPKEWAKHVFKAHWDGVMNTDKKTQWVVPFRELPLPKRPADPAKNEIYEIYSQLLRQEYKLEKFRREFNLRARYPRRSGGEDQ
jgi:hypothetical protein